MDAHDLGRFADGRFAVVYSSHLLEHLEDPVGALREWCRVVRPGGSLILYVPHRDLYEKKRNLPSRFNFDHKMFLLPDRDEAPCTFSLVGLVARADPGMALRYVTVADDGYYDGGSIEAHPQGELSIEGVWIKR